MNKRYLNITGILWAVIGISCLIITIREFLNNGDKAWMFLIMTVLSLSLAAIRLYQRKKL